MTHSVELRERLMFYNTSYLNSGRVKLLAAVDSPALDRRPLRVTLGHVRAVQGQGHGLGALKAVEEDDAVVLDVANRLLHHLMIK